MPEFAFTPLADQEDVLDGMILGHIDITGKSGSATTRSPRVPDGGLGILLLPAVVDLLDGVAGLLRRGRGRFTCSDAGVTFRLKDRVLTMRRMFTVLDESSPHAVAEALGTAAQRLSDSHLPGIKAPTEDTTVAEDGTIEYVDYRIRLPEAIAAFQDARRSLTG
ncbi:hypothetical protein [Streptomyces sp. L2]|uniref:hypothetical protein n=1 Tax=Streptomyces sp. L2 TaxID=2162665 RepID=UPI001010AECB|nr:hypothetical protein [Streptomyces sp. L2]